MRIEPALNRLIATSWLTSAILLVGCGSGNGNRNNDMAGNSADSSGMRGEQAGMLANDSADMSGAGGMQGTAANTQLDDAQIANVAMTANRLDSTSAATVVDRLTNADAKNFARRMMTEHGAVMDSIRSIASNLGSNATGNQLSTSMEQMAAQPLQGTGATLDRAYMDSEVAMHQHVLNTIDQALLPQVRDASLKSLVERMRTAVAGHLQDAESIRSRLGAN